jgi:hypothetical protein
MNKIILQIGLLAFCVAAVVFKTQGTPLLETVAQSFIVFILVVVGAAGLLIVGSLFRTRSSPKESGASPVREQPAQQDPPTQG